MVSIPARQPVSTELRELLLSLPTDEWRRRSGFSPDVTASNKALIEAKGDTLRCVDALSAWLQRNQPCLFGRMAAKNSAITYCFLQEDELLDSDEAVAAKIASARLAWTRAAFEGRSSGFVILAVGERLLQAAPSTLLMAFAQRLAQLYLLQEVEPNSICLEEVFLAVPGYDEQVFRWDAGVNYFGVQGDGRWWQDHRIPGGVGYSVNSVGHMVMSGTLRAHLNAIYTELGLEESTSKESSMRSLHKALAVAMQTIANASDAVSGPATELLDRQSDAPTPPPRCPVELPASLAGKDHCTYHGWYHTDETIPAEYFTPDVQRSSRLIQRSLDFTYLFDNALANPDFRRMGVGRQIRTADEKHTPMPMLHEHAERVVPKRLDVGDCPRLVHALYHPG
jgi:hypothetical protein